MTEQGRDSGCPACAAAGQSTSIVYDAPRFPVSSCIPASARDAAVKVRRGDIALVGCRNCGFIHNAAFDSRLLEYSDSYEDRQCFSATFNRFQSELIGDLVERFDLRDKDVIEIGCGKGVFLKDLCAAGGNRGIGIDPVCDQPNEPGISFLRELFGLHHRHLPVDFVCCRHTLEHIEGPLAFLRTLRAAIGDRRDTGIFFEVPDTTRLLAECAFWDIQYEHCSYFTAGSLGRLFRSCGFDVARMRLLYGSQYLTIEARPAPMDGTARRTLDEEETPGQVIAALERFGTDVSIAVGQWNDLLASGRYSRIVIWGAGAKCQGFMNVVPAAARVQYVVDVNPFLQGRFMVGTGVEIKPPEFLRAFQPDLVIVMNPVYRAEIAADLAALGLGPGILALR